MALTTDPCRSGKCGPGRDSSCSGTDTYADASAYLKLTGITPRNISKDDVLAYAQRAGAQCYDEVCSTSMHLLAGRFMYWKQNPGDCGTQTSISLGVPGVVTKVAGVGAVAAGATAAVAGLAATGPGVAAGIGAAAGTAATVVGLIALPFAIWSIISAHHKLEVAKDEQDYCDVCAAYNEWESTMEQGLQNGTYAVADVKATVSGVEAQLLTQLTIRTKGKNAGYYLQMAIKALDLYMMEKGYDALAAKVASSTSSLPGQSPTTTAAGTTAATTTTTATTTPMSNTGKFGIAAAAGTVAALVA